jgi:hypothetical protein
MNFTNDYVERKKKVPNISPGVKTQQDWTGGV